MQIYGKVAIAMDVCFRLGASASQVGANGDTSKLLGIISQLQQRLQDGKVGEGSPTKPVVMPPPPGQSMLALEAPHESVEAPNTKEEARDEAKEACAAAEDVLQAQRAAAQKQASLKATEDLPRPIATPARSHSEVLEKIRKLRHQDKESRKPTPLKIGGGSNVSGGSSVCSSELRSGPTDSEALPPAVAAAGDEDGRGPEVGLAAMVNSTTHKKEYMRLESSRHLGLSCLWEDLLNGSLWKSSVLMIFT